MSKTYHELSKTYHELNERELAGELAALLLTRETSKEQHLRGLDLVERREETGSAYRVSLLLLVAELDPE